MVGLREWVGAPEFSERVQFIVKTCIFIKKTDNTDELEEITRDLIKDLFLLLANIFASGLNKQVGSDIFSSDDENPGYIILKFKDDILRIPFQMASFAPDKQVLESLCNLGRRIQCAKGSTPALSGSALMHKAFLAVGDLDFCEYIPIRDEYLSNEKLDDLIALNNDLYFINVRFGQKEFKRPWKQALKHDTVFSLIKTKSMKGFCHFVAEPSGFQAVEVTNCFLRIDPDRPDEGAGTKSFSMQEAPIGDWVPRALTAPIELANYVSFLVESIKNQRQGNPVKAMKRAFSLSRVMMIDDITDGLMELSDETGFVELASAKARYAIGNRLLDAGGDPILRDWGQKLVDGSEKIGNAVLSVHCDAAEKSQLIESKLIEFKRKLDPILDKLLSKVL